MVHVHVCVSIYRWYMYMYVFLFIDGRRNILAFGVSVGVSSSIVTVLLILTGIGLPFVIFICVRKRSYKRRGKSNSFKKMEVER